MSNGTDEAELTFDGGRSMHWSRSGIFDGLEADQIDVYGKGLCLFENSQSGSYDDMNIHIRSTNLSTIWLDLRWNLAATTINININVVWYGAMCGRHGVWCT